MDQERAQQSTPFEEASQAGFVRDFSLFCCVLLSSIAIFNTGCGMVRRRGTRGVMM